MRTLQAFYFHTKQKHQNRTQARQGAKKYASLENFKRILFARGECVALNSRLHGLLLLRQALTTATLNHGCKHFSMLLTPQTFLCRFSKVFIHIKCNSHSRERFAKFAALWQLHLTLILFPFSSCMLACVFSYFPLFGSSCDVLAYVEIS